MGLSAVILDVCVYIVDNEGLFISYNGHTHNNFIVSFVGIYALRESWSYFTAIIDSPFSEFTIDIILGWD